MSSKDKGGAAVADPPEAEEQAEQKESPDETEPSEFEVDRETLAEDISNLRELRKIFTTGIKGRFREKLMGHIRAEIEGCLSEFRHCKPAETPKLQGRLAAFEELEALLDGSAFTRLEDDAVKALREFEATYPLLAGGEREGSDDDAASIAHAVAGKSGTIILTFEQKPEANLIEEMEAAGFRDLKGTIHEGFIKGKTKAGYGCSITDEAQAKAAELTESIPGVHTMEIVAG